MQFWLCVAMLICFVFLVDAHFPVYSAYGVDRPREDFFQKLKNLRAMAEKKSYAPPRPGAYYYYPIEAEY